MSSLPAGRGGGREPAAATRWEPDRRGHGHSEGRGGPAVHRTLRAAVHPRRRAGTLIRTLGAWAVVLSTPGTAQALQDPGSFGDPRSRVLVTEAIRLRSRTSPAADTELWMDGRTRVRLRLPGQWKWRMRTLFRKETVSRIRLGPSGGATATVLRRRRGAPLIGDDLIDRPALWGAVGFDPEGGPPLFGILGLELAEVAGDVPIAPPSALRFFGGVVQDPIGADGPAHYRYTLGDTLTAQGGQRLQAVELRSDHDAWGRIVGLVWFDVETRRPVRALLRPSAPVPVPTGLRGLIRSIPLVEEDARGDIHFVLIEYDSARASGHRPVTIRVDGRLLAFWNQAILPVHSEWAVRWNPEGREAPEPPPPLSSVGTFADASAGLSPFIRELDRVSGPEPAPGPWTVATRSLSSVRFNQVQGVNVQLHYPVPVGPRTVLHTRLRIPTTSFAWTGSVGLERGRFPTRSGIELFSRLRDTDPLRVVNGALSSISALVSGYDDGNYFLASGARAWLRFGELPVSGFVSLFAERHEEAPRRAFYSLLEPAATREPPTVLPITPGSYVGTRAQTQLQFGEDPQRGLLLVRAHGQAAVGRDAFLTIGTTTDLVSPLPGPFTLGLRLEAGVSAGSVPGQARYYLGGVRTVRGYPAATASGSSVLLLNAEVGTDVPLARLVAFGDVGWTESLGRLLSGPPLRSLGAGISIGDGVLRLEVAKGLSEGGVWKLNVATSGIF